MKKKQEHIQGKRTRFEGRTTSSILKQMLTSREGGDKRQGEILGILGKFQLKLKNYNKQLKPRKQEYVVIPGWLQDKRTARNRRKICGR